MLMRPPRHALPARHRERQAGRIVRAVGIGTIALAVLVLILSSRLAFALSGWVATPNFATIATCLFLTGLLAVSGSGTLQRRSWAPLWTVIGLVTLYVAGMTYGWFALLVTVMSMRDTVQSGITFAMIAQLLLAYSVFLAVCPLIVALAVRALYLPEVTRLFPPPPPRLPRLHRGPGRSSLARRPLAVTVVGVELLIATGGLLLHIITQWLAAAAAGLPSGSLPIGLALLALLGLNARVAVGLLRLESWARPMAMFMLGMLLLFVAVLGGGWAFSVGMYSISVGRGEVMQLLPWMSLIAATLCFGAAMVVRYILTRPAVVELFELNVKTPVMKALGED